LVLPSGGVYFVGNRINGLHLCFLLRRLAIGQMLGRTAALATAGW
jgi:hypothetical protein